MRSKLGLIISLSLVGVLVITAIILGVVKVDYSPKFFDAPNSIMITDKDSSAQYHTGRTSEGEQKENFVKLVSLYNGIYKQSVIASTFAGNAGNEVVVQYESGSVPSKSGYRVLINYPTKAVKASNGIEYQVEQLIFNLEDKAGMQEVTLYLNIKGSTTGYLTVKTLANTKMLYDFVSELEYK
ncbi:MAG: hypothetical protein ACOX6H_01305 [Christensenellales bacterium]|jgi:hypothetical protein